MNRDLFGLSVRGVMVAVRAILFELHPRRIVLLILFCSVVAILAIVTRQCNHQAILFLCHYYTLCLDCGDDA